MEIMTTDRTWYVDATFKVVKDSFKQLLSVHAFMRSGDKTKQLSLCFVLMSGKKTKDNRKVLKTLKTILPMVQTKTFVVDFETGLWKAIRHVFPEAIIKGCVFHFAHVLYRHIKTIGLKTANEANGDVHSLLRKTFALPLLPTEDIPEAFKKLKKKSATEMTNNYFDYVEQTWMNSSIWRIEAWSVYGRSTRTNNDIEGYHNKFNQRAQTENLPFHLLIQLLYIEAKDVRLQEKLAKEKKLHRYKWKRTKDIQGRLMKLWEEYRQMTITTRHLLDACAAIYAPVDE